MFQVKNLSSKIIQAKKYFLPVMVAVGLTATAAPQLSAGVEALNTAIQKLLFKYNTEKSLAKVEFVKIETNDVRATDVNMNAHYKKVGSENTLEISLNKLSYHFDAVNPLTKLNAKIGLDLTKYATPEQLDFYVEIAQDLLQAIVTESLKEYGTAARVKLDILEKTKDEAGHYATLKARAELKVIMSELPEKTPISEVFVKEVRLQVNINVKTGTSVNLILVSNPAYKGFNTDEMGLKEYLDALKKADPKLVSEFESIIADLDKMATSIVEPKKDDPK
jgi:hypothetical protein